MLVPRAVPGLLAGLSFLWVFLFVPAVLDNGLKWFINAYDSDIARWLSEHIIPQLRAVRSTIFSVWLAYSVVWLAYGLRLITTALLQVGPELEEAARAVGASRGQATRDVTLPLAMPGLVASAIFVFLESLDEFTGTYFVGVPDITTLPLIMFTASIAGNYQIAAITALVLLVPSVGFMLVVERFFTAETLAKLG